MKRIILLFTSTSQKQNKVNRQTMTYMIYKLTTFHFYHNRNEDNNSGVDKEVNKILF